jgi:N-acetylglutamate synthase-like GNAT family acetyltransferase
MSITIRQAHPDEIESLIPLLLQAEESERALRWGLKNLVDTVYRADEAGSLVGAATMQWRGDLCEIMELAIAHDRHGQGIGRQLVAWLIDEARRRGKTAVLVGTANSSIGNIAFYQKVGFRMEQVRKDYFRYYREPHYENGIQIRDMLVFRYDLVAEHAEKSAQRYLATDLGV